VSEVKISAKVKWLSIIRTDFSLLCSS